MTDTPEPDRLARDLAERVHAAYAQQARGALHPQQEQTLLARLAEAARPHLDGDLAAALNGALDAWEEAEPDIRGPRLAEVDAQTGMARLRP